MVEIAIRRAREVPLSRVAAIVPMGVVVGAASVLTPTFALAAVLGAVFIALAVFDLAAGVTAFLLLTFFEQLPGIPASQLSAIKAAGFVLVLLWLARTIAEHEWVPLVSRAHPVIAFALAAFVVVAFMSIVWASDPGVARSDALRLAQGPLLLLVVFSSIRTPQHLRWIIFVYVVGAAATAAVGIVKTPADAKDVGRLSGGIQDPNELAAALLPAIPMALFGLAVVKKGLARWGLVAGFVLPCVALFMTGSRGGLIGLGVMFVSGLALSGPLRQQVAVGVMLVTGVALAYYTLFAPPQVLWRVTNFTAQGGSGREDLWSIALAMFRNHPVLGVGAGNFQVLEPSYAAISSVNLTEVKSVVDIARWVHNTYLHILVEFGIVGLACFAVVVVGSFVAGIRAVSRLSASADRDTEILARGFLIGITGMFAAFTFITAQYEKELWLLLGVTLALTTVAQRVAEVPDDVSVANDLSMPVLRRRWA
jgi:O-antigen ligase